MNNVSLIGRTTDDIELRTTTNGKSVINFTLATDTGKDETLYIDCEAWNDVANRIATYIHKGNRLGVTGRLKPKQWEKDGKKYSKIIISVLDADTNLNGQKPSQVEPQPKKSPTPYDLEHNLDAFSVLPDESPFGDSKEGLPF